MTDRERLRGSRYAEGLALLEPTKHLDIRAAHDLLAVVRDLGLTTLCVLHDLNLAAGYCDRVAVLDPGRLVAVGAPADVLTADRVRDVFTVATEVLTHPVTGRPLLAFGP